MESIDDVTLLFVFELQLVRALGMLPPHTKL